MGLVRGADQGPLFLDEIAELQMSSQPTPLRLLQEREVLAIGATRPQPVDFRLVAATHRDLATLVGQQRFRADLLARVSGFVVRLPALWHRMDDLGILIATLLDRYMNADKRRPTISVEAMRHLLRHVWPLAAEQGGQPDR